MNSLGFKTTVVKPEVTHPSTGLAVTVAPEAAAKDVAVSAIEVAAVNGFINEVVLGDRIELPTVTVSEVTVMDEFGKPLPTSRKALFKPVLDKEIQEANIMAFMGQGKFAINASQKDALENEDITKDQYFPTFNGLGVLKHITINNCLFRSVLKSDNLPGLDPRSDFLTVDITNRIPIELLRDFMANAKAIYELHRTEFAAQFYRRPDGTFYVYYPVQKVFPAHVDYSADENAKFKLRATDQLVMEVHSHANMGAFFSGGDNANEKSPCFYAVVGGFGGAQATAVARAKYLEYEIPLTLTEIFDFNGSSLEDMMSLATLSPAKPEAVATAKTGQTYGTSVYTGNTAAYGAYGSYRQPYAASNWEQRQPCNQEAGWWQRDKRLGTTAQEQAELDEFYGCYTGGTRQTKRQQRQAAMATTPKPTLSVDLTWLLDLIPDNAINIAIVQLSERKAAIDRGVK